MEVDIVPEDFGTVAVFSSSLASSPTHATSTTKGRLWSLYYLCVKYSNHSYPYIVIILRPSGAPTNIISKLGAPILGSSTQGVPPVNFITRTSMAGGAAGIRMPQQFSMPTNVMPRMAVVQPYGPNSVCSRRGAICDLWGYECVWSSFYCILLLLFHRSLPSNNLFWMNGKTLLWPPTTIILKQPHTVDDMPPPSHTSHIVILTRGVPSFPHFLI